MKSEFKFHHDIRVRFADTDLQGIVFNGNYLTYYDVAWTEYFRELGLTYQKMLEMNADTVLARTEIDFKAPARFDDILEIYVRVAKIGNSSLLFRFEIYLQGEDRLLNAATSLYVCIDSKTLKSTRVPDALRSLISELEGTTVNRE
ncbi:MAG: acyl-CoA thioesterase [Acidobacteria bacterium]|nr:acyl-CoA thioesterase [Acidobacteriota bacterium]